MCVDDGLRWHADMTNKDKHPARYLLDVPAPALCSTWNGASTPP